MGEGADPTAAKGRHSLYVHFDAKVATTAAFAPRANAKVEELHDTVVAAARRKTLVACADAQAEGAATLERQIRALWAAEGTEREQPARKVASTSAGALSRTRPLLHLHVDARSAADAAADNISVARDARTDVAAAAAATNRL